MYERHDYSDIKFPIKFHRNFLYAKGCPDTPQEPQLRDIIGSGRAHWHEGIEILRMVEGEGNVHVNSDVFQASPGQIAVVCSNNLHRVSKTEGKCAFDCLIINYGVCTGWGFDPCEIPYDVLFYDEEIYSLFDKISEEYENKKPYYKSVVLASCLEIMSLLTRNHVLDKSDQDVSSNKKVHLVRQIMQYITRNPGEKITLKSIGNELKYSHFYLEHIFNELTGMSIMEYLTEVRIREAEKFLLTSDSSIGEIAEKCGYSNPAAFSTVFRKKCGIQPKEYRSANRKIGKSY